ncbi:undecaprenyldiphospho-muramoylpentapeptide beta-N-acetylglucosaminyltransferase [Phyllobacterium endophyticum]|uniref:UDP-N-acetylglucosamine--N-acetylmuramyl-(pentapeptide) pyrophosphoryl-undecaprenol N-acetylglucosamine transferase n=1 Tax=Phyllobacterium endophyticum TaxID=1149773 RepID=A0A2P7ANI3_9HYPH|nr:undecaprenyldiphospho-muramoylpentapeptide beta-N-acetylglucosaminyltransferase [Phyllobacterium endophyticum]MBB3233918.1 UDP-N-acetylglucosamine--N-acetylmuramyl-(pentapeptide) pyrophosphoryl-undecaprenol N-acetylglucosamine transferase [Phyllobacterium endophyticum]PSH55774.1 undecaprenyldiphospho-muramoylpentapeptide beta-N-acetylglucosaminyltransferase [Phyllobacterium endophyticum]TYR43704.1 undecaprenyldiphospho-muramoylpentapeptide beta-N-acetylglucosaminyltransferase [Phyllobacterium
MPKGVIFLAAGGTGGHLFPAEALAYELIARDWEIHLVTDDRARRFTSSFPAEKIHVVRSATIAGRNPVALARTFWTLWLGNLDSRKIFRAMKPKLVAGFGGYPTLPPLYAASGMGIPTLVHEQNAVMGRANKALAPRVNAIAGGFLSDTGSLSQKIITTGNPVRPAVLAEVGKAYKASQAHQPFHFLVFGGSQGAQYFSTAVPAAIELLAPELRERLFLTQQARAEDESHVRSAYQSLGIKADVAPFFVDMPHRIAESHFILSRSGASTVSEIAAIGRPAILVPFPHALDHDQAANAAALQAAGGAEVVKQSDLSPERIASILTSAMSEPTRLAFVAEKARATGKPEATRLLADLAEAIASGQRIEDFKKGVRP